VRDLQAELIALALREHHGREAPGDAELRGLREVVGVLNGWGNRVRWTDNAIVNHAQRMSQPTWAEIQRGR
jgi:hypothetical protein